MIEYLKPTEFLDHDHPLVAEFAARNTQGARDEKQKAAALYYAVRDGFQYDPYFLDLRPQGLKASTLLTRKSGYCVEKAILLAASARSAGICSRLSFYIVRNHIATGRLEKALKKDYLVFHGAAELLLDGEWRKATPAFNRQLCSVLGVAPLEFDGGSDSVFQEFDHAGGRFMEYIHSYGSFTDMPYELYLSELGEHYPHIFGIAGQSYTGLIFDFRNLEMPEIADVD